MLKTQGASIRDAGNVEGEGSRIEQKKCRQIGVTKSQHGGGESKIREKCRRLLWTVST